nr:hypothetical transcript [Hymenolepis microstoma]
MGDLCVLLLQGIEELPSLKELCVKAVAEKLDSLVTNCSDCTEPTLTWRFPHSNCSIASRMSGMILKELGDHKLLKQEHLSLSFQSTICASELLSTSTSHPVAIFDHSFSEGTLLTLHTPNVPGMCIEKESKLSTMVELGKLHNLHRPDMSRTNVDSQCLGVLVNSFKRLRYLDISETKVMDISCLTQLKSSLRSLFHNKFKVSSIESFRQMLLTILEVKELRTLEVSNIEYRADSRLREVDRLIEPGMLPHLEHSEMGGVLQRMLNYVPILIEDEWKEDGVGSGLGGDNEDIDEEGSDERDDSGEAGGDEDAFYAESNNGNGDDDVVDVEDDESVTDDDSDDDYDDYFLFTMVSNYLLYMKLIIGIDRVVFDYRRCCAAIFTILKHVNIPLSRTEAIECLIDMVNRMPPSELAAICANPSYMKNLIKCTAEMYLSKNLVDKWLAEQNDDRLSYLRDLYEIRRSMDVIEILNKFSTNNYSARENFIGSGGVEVCTLILKKIESNETMGETARRLTEMLKNVQSHLDSTV